MFSKTHSISSILSYAGADTHFKRYERPATRRGGRPLWSDNERPLDGNNQWHYRLEQGPDASYYDACLYHATMVRWHRPEQDGTRRVQVHHDERNTSTQFLWRMGWRRDNNFNFVDGGKACVPMIGNQLREGEYGALDLCYAQDGRVIKERSWHAPLRKAVTKPETLRYRRVMLAFFDTILHMIARVGEGGALYHTGPRVMDRGDPDRAYEGDEAALGRVLESMRCVGSAYYNSCKAVGHAYCVQVAVSEMRKAVLNHTTRRLRDAWEPLPDWQETYPKNNISVA